MRVLVTGATGNVGAHVVRALRERDAEVTAAGRDVDSVRARFGDEVTPAGLDFSDRATWAAALQGAERMFLMRPPAISNVRDTLLPFIDLARERGIDHIVFLSVAGAGKNKVVPHRAVEDHLRARSDRFTNLRPGFFAQNLQSSYRPDIVEDDRIYVPAGSKAPVNWIDARDIAEVAAIVLEDPREHRGCDYTLTGPGAIPWSEVTSVLSAVLGRPIRYEPASVLGYAWHLSRRGLPRAAVLVQTVLHVLLRFGQGATEDPTLERLLGRPGRDLKTYVQDYAQLWARHTSSSGSGGSQGRPG